VGDISAVGDNVKVGVANLRSAGEVSEIFVIEAVTR